jgi:cephalosporin-C deacetylase
VLFDLPLEQLREYRPQRDEPSDFDAFWSSTLAEARRHPLAAQFEPYDVGLTTVESFDVTFAATEVSRLRPAATASRARVAYRAVEYIGYGGGRGSPLDWLVWPAGLRTSDTRGQGSQWRPRHADQIEGVATRLPAT